MLRSVNGRWSISSGRVCSCIQNIAVEWYDSHPSSSRSGLGGAPVLFRTFHIDTFPGTPAEGDLCPLAVFHSIRISFMVAHRVESMRRLIRRKRVMQSASLTGHFPCPSYLRTVALHYSQCVFCFFLGRIIVDGYHSNPKH